MNQRDRANLEFLLTASPETLADWYDKMPLEDVEYAADLLYRYNEELIVRSKLIETIEVFDTTAATEYLKKFTRK